MYATKVSKDKKVDNIDENMNNNLVANNNDAVDPKQSHKEYILTSCSTLDCQSSNYQQTIPNGTTDAQRIPLANAPKSVIPNRANSGIVLITAKLNQSDESKLIHYSSSGSCNNTLNKTNLDIFNSVQKIQDDFMISTSQSKTLAETTAPRQSKTATILVSKSKTKSGLPLLLRKSK